MSSGSHHCARTPLSVFQHTLSGNAAEREKNGEVLSLILRLYSTRASQSTPTRVLAQGLGNVVLTALELAVARHGLNSKLQVTITLATITTITLVTLVILTLSPSPLPIAIAPTNSPLSRLDIHRC